MTAFRGRTASHAAGDLSCFTSSPTYSPRPSTYIAGRGSPARWTSVFDLSRRHGGPRESRLPGLTPANENIPFVSPPFHCFFCCLFFIFFFFFFSLFLLLRSTLPPRSGHSPDLFTRLSPWLCARIRRYGSLNLSLIPLPASLTIILVPTGEKCGVSSRSTDRLDRCLFDRIWLHENEFCLDKGAVCQVRQIVE